METHTHVNLEPNWRIGPITFQVSYAAKRLVPQANHHAGLTNTNCGTCSNECINQMHWSLGMVTEDTQI